MSADTTDSEVDRHPNDDEVFAVVTEVLGGSRLTVQCMDGVERLARIPGRLQNRVWIHLDDLIILEPWAWQDEKGDVVHKYDEKEAEQLQQEGLLDDFEQEDE